MDLIRYHLTFVLRMSTDIQEIRLLVLERGRALGGRSLLSLKTLSDAPKHLDRSFSCTCSSWISLLCFIETVKFDRTLACSGLNQTTFFSCGTTSTLGPICLSLAVSRIRLRYRYHHTKEKGPRGTVEWCLLPNKNPIKITILSLSHNNSYCTN